MAQKKADLESLLTQRLDPETQKQRTAERNRRYAKAAHMAKTALSKLHPDDYSNLYDQAAARIWEECGPLPGDDVRSRSSARGAVA